jgi:hypothetical protein
VKHFRWILVLSLLGAVVCVSAAPRVDLPETAFNEADAPVNLAPPLRSGIPIIAPTHNPIVVSPASVLHCPSCVVEGLLLAPASLTVQRHRVSLQYLLCTFLI